MAAMIFPAAPADGDTILQPNGKTYIYNAAKARWEFVPAAIAADVTQFISPPTAIVPGQTTTFAHGLGAAPNDLKLFLECISTEGGWAVGDRMDFSAYQRDNDTANQRFGAVVASNTTDVIITMGNLAGGFSFLSYEKNTGVMLFMDNTKWQMIAIARLFA